jgi:hypothetical protein
MRGAVYDKRRCLNIAAHKRVVYKATLLRICDVIPLHLLIWIQSRLHATSQQGVHGTPEVG